VANAAYLTGEEPLNFTAFAAALEQGHSTQVGIDQDETFMNDLEPYVFSVIAMQSDVLMHSQMLRAPDQASVLDAQECEVRGLEDKQVFQYVQKGDLPKSARLLNAVWSYRRKRRPPDGTLWKHKANLCVDGSRQLPGLDYTDYTESFAPIVQWSTVRLVMILVSMLNLESCQIDFTQAFTQADIEEDIYMRLPQGWQVDDTDNWCIKLKKNLYGLVQASRSWYKTLSAVFISMGFKQSSHDPCLFLRDDCMIVLYMDDCCIFAPNTAVIDQLINTLRSAHQLKMSDPAPVEDFLGIHIEKQSDGTTHLTQQGLIDSILMDLHFFRKR